MIFRYYKCVLFFGISLIIILVACKPANICSSSIPVNDTIDYQRDLVDSWRGIDTWSIIGSTLPGIESKYGCRITLQDKRLQIYNFGNLGIDSYLTGNFDRFTGCIIIPDQFLLDNNRQRKICSSYGKVISDRIIKIQYRMKFRGDIIYGDLILRKYKTLLPSGKSRTLHPEKSGWKVNHPFE